MSTATHTEREPSWILIIAITIALIVGLVTGCAHAVDWGQVGKCGAVRVTEFLRDAVLDIFAGPKPELDGKRMLDLGLEHGPAAARCAVEEILAARPPPGVSASVPQRDAETLARMELWLASIPEE